MIHALVLGLVIAIILMILIQKVTSGFTAAECDARYTLDYRACNDAYEKAKRACSGRNKTSCEQEAFRVKDACIDAAAAAKITCLGPAAASGDVVATQQIQQVSKVQTEMKTASVVTASPARVTPGAAFAPAPAPVPAVAAAPLAACEPGATEVIFPGLKAGETITGGSRPLVEGEAVCRKAAPAPSQCDFGAGYMYHGGGGIQPECLKPRTA